jgi:hypothetical protein
MKWLIAGGCDDPEPEETVSVFLMPLLLNITESHGHYMGPGSGSFRSSTGLNPLDAPYLNINTL